jgi:hypothetical protein
MTMLNEQECQVQWGSHIAFRCEPLAQETERAEKTIESTTLTTSTLYDKIMAKPLITQDRLRVLPLLYNSAAAQAAL